MEQFWKKAFFVAYILKFCLVGISMKIKDLQKKMLKLLTLGDEIACGPKINNHRFSMLRLFIGQNEECISDLWPAEGAFDCSRLGTYL